MILIQEIKQWDLTGKEIEYIPMTWEDRQRTRQRIKTKSGLELGLTLPTGTLLRPGDILHIEGNLAFIVAAREEDVLVIKPSDWREAALVAHHIGNQHKTIAIEPDGILVLYDLPLEVFFKKIKVTFRRELRPFNPHFQSHHP
jgi:urease accessory protein